MNVTNADGEIVCPALDHTVPDLGCSYHVMLKKFYEGADEKEVKAAASTFATTYS